MKVSVIIPTRNRAEPLRGTLESLLNQTVNDFEIIVVDQSPEPNRSEEVCSGLLRFAQVCFHTHRSQPQSTIANLSKPQPCLRYFHVDSIGSPAARNYGIERAEGEVVLSCDDDIVASPTLLASHLRNYADPTVGGVAGRVLTKEDKPLERIRCVGTCNDYTGWMTGNFNATTRCDVEHVQGSNCSFRHEVIQQVGGFDPAFTMLGHFEEADLSLRVRRAGWRIVFDPDAVVEHLQFPAAGNRPMTFRERTYWHFHNYALLFWKDMRRAGLPLFLAVQSVRAAGYAVRKRDPALLGIGLCGLARGFQRAWSGKNSPSASRIFDGTWNNTTEMER